LGGHCCLGGKNGVEMACLILGRAWSAKEAQEHPLDVVYFYIQWQTDDDFLISPLYLYLIDYQY